MVFDLMSGPHDALRVCFVTDSLDPRGLQAVWNAYVGSMRQAGFTANVPMYVASGLLTYGANDGEQSVSFLVFSPCM